MPLTFHTLRSFQRLLRLTLAAGALGYALLFSQLTQAQDIKFSRAEIQHNIDKHMPLMHQHQLFTLQVSEPIFHLNEQEQRIGVHFKLAFNSLLGFASQGSASLDGQPRYHPKNHSFYLDDARVTHIQLEGIPEPFVPQIQQIIQELIRPYLAEHPLYTIQGRNMSETMAKMMLRSIHITNDEVIAKLGVF